MSVKKTAYDTTACQGFVMTKTVHALQEGAIHGWLSPVPGSRVLAVMGVGVSDAAIPAFAHPALFDDVNKQPQIAVDVRPYGRYHDGEFRVRNTTEYALCTARGRLNWIWVNEAPTLLRDISPMPLQVFATWIAEQVTRRFALDPAEQMKVSIYAGIWYLSNFLQDHGYSFGEEERQRMAMTLSRALRIKIEDILRVFREDNDGATVMPGEGCPVIANTVHFCNLVSSISVRLQGLNAGVLYAILGATWYGTNSKEMVAVACEHPPTWIAILLAAVQERTFKNSGITKITERSGIRDSARTYQAAVLNLIAHANG